MDNPSPWPADRDDRAGAEEPPFVTLRPAAKQVYGADAAAYTEGRPEYPAMVFDVLQDSCDLRPGADVLEIGPGTGQATKRLVEAGAQVTAVEPDPGLATALRTRLPIVKIIEATAEEAPLGEKRFDLVAAATSWHWVEPAIGHPRLVRALRPGGHLAIWWTIFSDPHRPDPVVESVSHDLGYDVGGQRSGTRYQLDEDARRRELCAAGLTGVQVHRHAWSLAMTPARTRALFGSQIAILRLPADRQSDALDRLEAAAAAQPGSVDHRPLFTILYTARRT